MTCIPILRTIFLVLQSMYILEVTHHDGRLVQCYPLAYMQYSPFYYNCLSFTKITTPSTHNHCCGSCCCLGRSLPTQRSCERTAEDSDNRFGCGTNSVGGEPVSVFPSLLHDRTVISSRTTCPPNVVFISPSQGPPNIWSEYRRREDHFDNRPCTRICCQAVPGFLLEAGQHRCSRRRRRQVSIFGFINTRV